MRKSVEMALKKRIGAYVLPESFVKSLKSDITVLYNAVNEAEKQESLPELINEKEELSNACELLRIIVEENP